MNEVTIPAVAQPMPPILEFHRLSPHAAIPYRAFESSAAYDISACLLGTDGRHRTATVGPGITQTIPTGLAVRAPRNHCVLVCSRSGFATKGVFVANAPGVVDPDYIGEISVILTNNGHTPFYVKHGDRIAQLLIVPFAMCLLEEVDRLKQTVRGERGFGSTGR